MDEVDERQMPSTGARPRRPESSSSGNSGKMVQSSLNGGRDSTEALDEEVRYQRELKDRIKRSYVDLGMKPEGILLRGDDDDDYGRMLTDSLEIDDKLDYGVINSSHSASRGNSRQGHGEGNNGEWGESQKSGGLHDASNNFSQVGNGVDDENSERLEREDGDHLDIPNGVSSRQGEANGGEETDFSRNPQNVSNSDPLDSNKQIVEYQLRDSLEEDPSGHGEEYLKDSLEVDDDALKEMEGVQGDDPLQPGEVDANRDRRSFEEVNPHRTNSRQSEPDLKTRGGNVNNNAKTVESPPPDWDSSRTVAGDENHDQDIDDQGQGGRFDNFDDIGDYSTDQCGNSNEYMTNYADNGEYGSRQNTEDGRYKEEDALQRVTSEEEFQNSQSQEDLESGGHQHQSYSAAYSERRQLPPPPPPMPPEPPPPMLTGKPPSAEKISRPATNPFNVVGDQDDLALYQHPDTAVTLQTGPPTPPPPFNNSRTHPSPPSLTTQQEPPSPSGNVQPFTYEGQSRLLPHTKPPDGSYLYQFRDKQDSSEGNKVDARTPPSRTSDRSRSQAKTPAGSAGSRASLESLKFQDLPREESRTRAHRRQKQQARKGSASNVTKKPQVEYISEDSGDEDLHFVDELGNPVDALGNLLMNSPPPKEEEPLKLEYRMKRLPSKKKQDLSSGSGGSGSQRGSVVPGKRELVSSEEMKVSRNSQIPSATNRAARKTATSRTVSKVSRTSQVPSAAAAGRQSDHDRAGMTNTKESQSVVSEVTQTDFPVTEEVTSSVAQMEGDREGAVPPHEVLSASVRGMSTGSHTPLQNQLPQYMSHADQQSQYVNPSMQIGYRGYQQMPNQFVTGQPLSGQMVLTNQAAFISPSASYAFAPQVYAHLQPVVPVGMSPVQTVLQPVVQHPQMFIGGAQQVQPPQVVQLPGQQQHHAGPNFGPSDRQHVQIESRAPGDSGGGYVDIGGGGGGARYVDTDGRRTGGTEHSPLPKEDTSFPGESGSRQRKHPNGVRGLLAERREAGRNGQGRAKKKTPDSPKTGKNFIDANRNNVRNLPSSKKYQDMYANNAKSQKSPMNSRQPLPNISQEMEGDVNERWAYREDAVGTEEDDWTKQLVEEQRMMVLSKRSQSESDVLNLQGNLQGPAVTQGQRGGLGNDNGNGPRLVPGQMYSYSADRAVLQARMQGPGGYDPRRPTGDDITVARAAGERVSERERFAYTHPMPARCSPFEVLPDIERADNETRTSDPDGYLVKLQKQRHQHPAYKEYTIRDYRALKRDIKLGGLGPDPDQVQEKQEKAQRQKEYARAIMEQNKKALKKASKPWTPPKEQPPSLENTKRGLALKYAKNIPRPPLRTNQEELHAQLYGRGSKQSNPGEREGTKTYMLEEMDKLEELAERHRQEKEEIEKLRNGHTP